MADLEKTPSCSVCTGGSSDDEQRTCRRRPPPPPCTPLAAAAILSSRRRRWQQWTEGWASSTTAAVAHIVTAVIGSGVLALPYCVAILGWVAGPLLILASAWLTLYTSLLLAECYGIKGKLHRTYSGCVGAVFGRWGFHACAWVQHVCLVLYCLAYTVTGAEALQTVVQSVCAQHGVASGCPDSFWIWALVFGGIQLVLGQLPSLRHFWLASVIGAAMSMCYSTISIAISSASIPDAQWGSGTVGGLDAGSASDKAWECLTALGAILFSFNIALILVEVQDTLRSPSSEAAAAASPAICRRRGDDDAPLSAVAVEAAGPIRQMRRAINISMAAMTVIYMAVAATGYAALGAATPQNILTGPWGQGWPPAKIPPWVIQAANTFVFVRTVPAYQIYSLPFLCFVEEQLELLPRWPRWLTGARLRLVWRSAFVGAITLWACLMPFFAIVCGLVGSISFFPISCFFPIEMWIRMKRPPRGTVRALRALSGCALLVSLATTAGSIERLIASWGTFSLFGT